MFGLGALDLLCCCYQGLLLPIHVRNTAAAHITYITPYSIHDSPHSRSIQVEQGKVESF